MRNLSGLVWIFLFAGLFGATVAAAQEQPWSVRAANAAMKSWPATTSSPAGTAPEWTQGQGVLLEGLEAVWKNTVDRQDFLYIEQSVNPPVGPEGQLSWPKAHRNQMSASELGQPLMLLYGVTLEKRYYNAATTLDEQLSHQPPSLDGFDRAAPFLAAYALRFHHREMFPKLAQQFATRQYELFGNQARGEKGLTGKVGVPRTALYVAALVDTIPSLREDPAARKKLITILNTDAETIARRQDSQTGLWNKLSANPAAKVSPDVAASCLFVYALAKGVRRGYLPERYDAVAERGYRAVISQFVTGGPDDSFALHGTPSGPLEMGAFILASTEIENVKNAKIGRGDNVMVDGWFNSQMRTDVTGHEIYFHYKWSEESEPGYSLWGHAFRNFGARTTSLYAEPTFENLKPAQVYIIASPDNLEKNPHAHFANAQDAEQIARWVKSGGVLAIMENDTSFADLEHFNIVSEKFGIHFNSVLRMHVVGRDWAMGRFHIDGNGPIFDRPLTCYVKDVSTISVSGPARAVYTHEGDIFMAVAKYGKGTVYAMVDPWFYNEYTNGLKLPAEYQNYAAGVELARWLLQPVPGHKESKAARR